MDAKQSKLLLQSMLGTFSAWNSNYHGAKYFFSNVTNNNPDVEKYILNPMEGEMPHPGGDVVVYIRDNDLYIRSAEGEMKIDKERLTKGEIAFESPGGIEIVLTKPHDEGIRE